MEVAKGLAGVVVDSTAVADVQASGVLSYRGHSIASLVEMPFERVVALLLEQPVEVGPAQLNPAETAWLLAIPRATHPMRVLQSSIVLLEATAAEDWQRGVELAAKLPAVLATHLHGQSISVTPSDCYGQRVLGALRNVPAAEIPMDHARAFNTAQILQLEHSFNAGTFAARVVASTLADISAAIAAGFGALSGPLHGGADEAALKLVDSLDGERDIQQYLDHVLGNDLRVPGMGHREYRVRDPRAEFLQDWAYKLSRDTEHAATYDKLNALEEQFRQRMQARGKPVYANVEYYKGLVYRVLGLPDNCFTAGFAMARVFGYIAHFVESRVDNRIYRPQARYIGS